jgi:TrpR-related protein YerC/YecD
MKKEIAIWDNPLPKQFCDVVFAMQTKKELQDFLRDVMTEKEIYEVSARLEAARLLQQKVAYTEIAKRTKLSSRTIARICEFNVPPMKKQFFKYEFSALQFKTFELVTSQSVTFELVN